MRKDLLEAVKDVARRREEETKALGPTATKRLARARFINSEMARYTDDGEFVWMPQFGGPSLMRERAQEKEAA